MKTPGSAFAEPGVMLLVMNDEAKQEKQAGQEQIQKLEFPCVDEAELLLTAMHAGPRKLIVKRPPKGPHLAGVKPDYTNEGKAVRFDCFTQPKDRLEAFRKKIANDK